MTTPVIRPRILIVDDSEAHRYNLSRVLRHAGFETMEAENGTQGLAKALQNPDLIILDVRLQMLQMTDQEALDLMEKQTFQEHEEAVAKLQRAKLSSCQLPMYFLGWNGWLRVREGYQKARGNAYKLSEFNDMALKEGAVPLPVLGRLLQ